MEDQKCGGREYFTYRSDNQLRERDPLLNKFFLDTFTYSVGGAATGLVLGVFLRHPRFWSYFFAGVGAHTAYTRGPIKFQFLCCNKNTC